MAAGSALPTSPYGRERPRGGRPPVRTRTEIARVRDPNGRCHCPALGVKILMSGAKPQAPDANLRSLTRHSRTRAGLSPPERQSEANRSLLFAEGLSDCPRDRRERILGRIEHPVMANRSGQAQIDVGPSDRAAGSRMAQGAQVGTGHGRRRGTAQPISGRADPGRKSQHGVGRVGIGPRIAEGAHPLRRQQPYAVQLAAVGEHRKQARHAAGVKDSPRAGIARTAHVGTPEDRLGGADLRRDTLEERCVRRQRHRRSVDQARDPGLDLVGNSDPQIRDPQWLANLLAHESAEWPQFGVGAAYQLRDDPAEGVTLIGVAGAGLELRRHRRQLIDHPVVIGHQRRRHPLGHLMQARAMAQRVGDGGPGFAVFGELRPVMRDRLAVVDEPALRLDMQRGRGDRLDHRENREERVAVNFAPGGRVGDSAPHVHHRLAVFVDRHLQADFAMVVDGAIDRVLENLIEVRSDTGRR